MFDPYTMVARGVWTAATIAYLLGVTEMGIFDVTNYATPDEYIVPMLIAGLVMGLLTAVGIRRYFHDKAAEDAGYDNPYDLAYDRRYDFGTAVGFILGVAAGMYACPALVDYLFTGAGVWSYVLVTGLGTFIAVIAITTLIHFGLRKWLIKTKDYFESVSDAAGDLADTIKDLVDDGRINGSTGTAVAPETAVEGSDAPSQPTVLVMGQPVKKA